MGYIKELEDRINDYLDGDYEIVETDKIPSPEQVAFGKKAYKIKLTVLCIDLRKSTDLLKVHDKETCGKIHKSYLTIVSRIIKENGGEIRSFNGDSILSFWPADLKADLENAVRAAMIIKWALDVRYTKNFEKYSKLDFGIGVDWGDVYIVRAGLPRNDNNNDLVFLGMCVNFASAIANQAHGPHHIEISPKTYSNLSQDLIFGNDGSNVKRQMWTDGTVFWKDQKWSTKCTTWYWWVEE